MDPNETERLIGIATSIALSNNHLVLAGGPPYKMVHCNGLEVRMRYVNPGDISKRRESLKWISPVWELQVMDLCGTDSQHPVLWATWVTPYPCSDQTATYGFKPNGTWRERIHMAARNPRQAK